MTYRVEHAHWENGSGWQYSETIDNFTESECDIKWVGNWDTLAHQYYQDFMDAEADEKKEEVENDAFIIYDEDNIVGSYNY